MKIVLTGGLGHIGSAFLQQAPKILPDAHIVVIDDLSTQRYCSLFDLPKSLSYEFIEGRIQDIDMSKHLNGADALIHLGATTDAAGTAHNPNLIFDNNLPATESLIQDCIEYNVPFIFPSSTSVYGVQEGVVDEECEDVKPQSPYADCKIQEEELIRSYEGKGLRFCLARLGTIFGTSKGMRFHTAVNKFCWQATMKMPITVWSTAMDQKRPYLGLNDACRFFGFVIENELFDNQLYNVVTENYTVRDVVETIQKFVPDLNVEFVDNLIMNQLSYNVSSEKIKNKSFVFHDDLEAAIKDTVYLLRADLVQ
tara:strand:- start:10437 stop:11366 length:930 start_codon:yes stop_codon:yes gene_type:complete